MSMEMVRTDEDHVGCTLPEVAEDLCLRGAAHWNRA